jgi:hypothetical protein
MVQYLLVHRHVISKRKGRDIFFYANFLEDHEGAHFVLYGNACNVQLRYAALLVVENYHMILINMIDSDPSGFTTRFCNNTTPDPFFPNHEIFVKFSSEFPTPKLKHGFGKRKKIFICDYILLYSDEFFLLLL